MNIPLLTIALCLSASALSVTQKSSGKSIEITPLSLKDDKVTFSVQGGNEYTVPLNSLTEESRSAIREYFDSAQERESQKYQSTYSAVNEVAGQPLFDKRSLWQETGSSIANRLGWRRESLKDSTSSYRLYTDKEYLFLGTRPYCVTLYGGPNDQPERFSLVYANKGDFGSTVGMGPAHFQQLYPKKKLPQDLNDAISLDAEIIEEALTSALGTPIKQYYGEKEEKRRVLRWDAADHSFLLSEQEDEFVHLLIVPTSDADAEGKVERIRDVDLKAIQLQNVRKEDNGDVWIDNIPMVDQGPKGYCAPATFERAMRYMSVPADMYLLATAATTQKGTNTVKLADDCKRIVRSKARRIKELELTEDLKLSTVRRFIDKGVPILWQMRSLERYNHIANQRTKARKDVQDWEKWAKEISEEAELVEDSLKARDNFHICMIIGYNESTNELAVSDSWGPYYELRWVSLEIAQAVTNYGGFAIDF